MPTADYLFIRVKNKHGLCAPNRQVDELLRRATGNRHPAKPLLRSSGLVRH